MNKYRVEFKDVEAQEWDTYDELIEIEAETAEEAVEFAKDYINNLYYKNNNNDMEIPEIWYRAYKLYINDFGELEYNFNAEPDYEIR